MRWSVLENLVVMTLLVLSSRKILISIIFIFIATNILYLFYARKLSPVEKDETSGPVNQQQLAYRTVGLLKVKPNKINITYAMHLDNGIRVKDVKKAPWVSLTRTSVLESPDTVFQHYPLDVNLTDIVHKRQHGQSIDVSPINPILCCTTLIGNHCQPKVFLVYLIKSHPSAIQSRMAIRQTWGRDDVVKVSVVKRIFVLGLSEDKQKQKDLSDENSLYHDFIQGDFFDSYNNTSAKMEFAIHWAVKNCSDARYLVFVDDDVLVNPMPLAKLLQSNEVSEVKKLYLGWFEGKHSPSRTKGSKWFLSHDEYPPQIFPPLAPAATYVLNQELATDVSVALQYVQRVRFDDVFLALIMQKLGIFPFHTERIDVSGHLGPSNVNRRHDESSLIAVWGEFTPDRLIAAWEALHGQRN